MSILAPDGPDQINPDWVGLLDARQSGWFLKDSDELFKGFPVSASDKVLDVGCGQGVATLFCAERGAAVTYVDIDPAVVDTVAHKVAEQGTAASHTGLVSDCEPLQVPDQSATRVICQEVLEHVADPDHVVSELVRAGEPGALYLLTVPGEQGENVQKAFAPAEYFEHPNHIRVFSESDFRSLAERNGLEILSYSSSGFYLTFWVCIQWAIAAARKRQSGDNSPGADDPFTPPYDDSLSSWATLWGKLIATPEGEVFKRELDKLLPKVQIIVGKKPA